MNLANFYKKKILSIKEIKKKIISLKKNKKTIALCHGVFDVVHPGHIRHFVYTKNKADVLLVSVTSDRFIRKGHYKPTIPEKLRAINLAALEVIDFVVIDDHLTSIDILNFLKPDLYSKGFEYSKKNNLITLEENKIINSYGGKFIFTPGDVIYSSSSIQIKKEKELNLDKEKIRFYMDENNVKFSDIKDTLRKKKNIKIHVVGDTIVDTHTITELIGGQIKTPTLSVKFNKNNFYLGGAAVVASHLSAAGCEVYFSTILGNDQLGRFVISNLKKRNIKTLPIIIDNRPTTEKKIIIANNYRIIKIDTLDNAAISLNDSQKICQNIKKIKCNGVVFSDFRHGIFNKYNINNLIKSIPKGVFKSADSQVATRWGNILDFKKFNLITPNEKEARFALADQDSNISSLIGRLSKESKALNVFLKLGERGACSLNIKKNSFTLPSFANTPVDPVGAGDAMLAYSTIAFIISKSHFISFFLGLVAAACATEMNGNDPINSDMMLKKIDTIESELFNN